MRELFSRLRPRPLEPTDLQTTANDEKAVRPVVFGVGVPLEDTNANSKEANVDAQPRPVSSSPDNDLSDDEGLSKDAQAGVQKMEATTKAWSKKHLITAYIL